MGVVNETVNLHIEHLVLDGVSEQERERVGQALQAELSRLLAEQGLPTGWRDGTASPTLNGGRFGIISGMSAEETGRTIAGKIYGAQGASGPGQTGMTAGTPSPVKNGATDASGQMNQRR